ncbi:Retron-type reverse transcriptase [Rhizobium sp. CG5]|uniref:reverse transcriptase domain-containing protein n=1 Tax=Rhizobium sp. CG5 TaxID=2726076 RepID=UPI00203367AF|nr:reverse transcriptase domain-containing protein [Rhizobium sp. CG5]MCM2472119.1 Retron-type reverse transcriptase [Rhizobium sp. CG5]
MTLLRPSIFGGSWINGSNAGSRYANLDNWPDNSNDNLSARGACDDPLPARRWPRSRRPQSTGVYAPGWSAFPSGFGEDIARSGTAGSSGDTAVETRDRHLENKAMARKYRNLIDTITSDANMREAFRLTSLGKRLTPGHLEYKEYAALNLHLLAGRMRDGTYQSGEPRQFRIFDPKERLISALPFEDRIAQQALCAVIAPIFDRTLLPRSFACRPGKGTHAAAILLQADMRRLDRDGPLHALKTDFFRYFYSIERGALWQLIETKISCRATLTLIEAMLPRQGIGLPIGSLTSQIFANIYAGVVDRHLQQDLGERCWYRYMDDIVVLGRDPDHLRKVRGSIEQLSRDRLGLRFSKWSIQPISRGVNFVGYRIWPSHKLLRRDSVTRARRKIRAYRAGGDFVRLERFLAAWTGHAKWADSRNLLRSLDVQTANLTKGVA